MEWNKGEIVMDQDEIISLEETRNNMLTIQKELLTFFNQEYAKNLNEMQDLQGEIIELRSEIGEIEKRKEAFKFQDSNSTHNVFSPLTIEDKAEGRFDVRLATLNEKYINVEAKIKIILEQLEKYKEKKKLVKDLSEQIHLFLKNESDQLQQADNENQSERQEFVKFIETSIIADVQAIKNKIELMARLVDIDPKRMKSEISYIEKITIPLEEKLLGIKEKIFIEEKAESNSEIIE